MDLNERSIDMEYPQGMLRPVIFVGCGGAGVKTVARARQMIGEYLEDSGWEGGIPRAWKFLGIDAYLPFEFYYPHNSQLPSECCVAMAFSSYQGIDSGVMAQYGGSDGSANNDLIGWRPRPSDLHIPLPQSPGQYRAQGRMMGIASYAGQIQQKIDWAFSEAAAGASELLELSQHLGISSNRGEQESKPIVIVLGSIAGGVGSGIMLDIIDLIKQTHADGAFPTLIAYTPDIFGAVQTDGMATNAAAFMSELMATSWSKEVSINPFIPYKGMSYKRGPHATYLIGRKNLRGDDLQDSSRVFESIAQYLTSLTTSPNAQVDFMYQQASGLQEAAQNSGGYGFLNQEFPGLINSFGVAKISTGRKHFRHWLEQLLGRAVIEHLARTENSGSSQTQNLREQQSASESGRNSEIEKYFIDCGLGIYLFEEQQQSQTNDEMRMKLNQFLHELKTDANPDANLNGREWLGVLFELSKNLNVSVLDSERTPWFLTEVQWGELAQQIEKSTLELALFEGLSKGVSFLKLLNVKLDEAIKNLETANQLLIKGRDNSFDSCRLILLGESKKRRMTINSAPIQKALTEFAKFNACKWGAERNVEIINSFHERVLPLIENLISKYEERLQRLTLLSSPQDGRPSEISEWPRLGSEVPNRLQPSVNEFLLEDESQWLRQVHSLFFGENEFGSGEFPDLNAVVHKIIKHRTSALGETSQSWLFDLQNSDDVIQMVRDFLLSEELGLKYYFEESIIEYLSPNSTSLTVTSDTSDSRVKVNYSRALQTALQWSAPLFEIDRRMCVEVHPHNLHISLVLYGVSFPEGHPARDFTSEVLPVFLSNNVDPTFSNFSDSENVTDSITLVSTCQYPVHPSVVRNFTEPLKLTSATANDGPNFFHRWQWRRSRTLTEFIPLSPATRLAAIRGFALARLTGAMSLADQESCQISGTDGVFQFPRSLLTLTSRNNVLPALLESMILTYADIDVKGIGAFSAYRTLIEFGWNHSDVEGEYEFPDFVNEILLMADYGKIQIQDESRSSRFLHDYESRFDAAKDYLRANLDRFEKLGSEAPSMRGWRNSIGTVDPDDTLTIELLPDLLSAYWQVLNQIQVLERR